MLDANCESLTFSTYNYTELDLGSDCNMAEERGQQTKYIKGMLVRLNVSCIVTNVWP